MPTWTKQEQKVIEPEMLQPQLESLKALKLIVEQMLEEKQQILERALIAKARITAKKD